MNKLWCEKYRPAKIEDCILPDGIKDTFRKIVETGDLPNMILSGDAGCGKTTIAYALCNEMKLDYMKINASEESGIDVLRSKIRSFASSMSLTGDIKVVILDEADYLNRESTQPALRSFIEEFSDNCRFIMTCNYKNKLIEALHSRCVPIEFSGFGKNVLKDLSIEILKRVEHILKTENVKYERKVVVEMIMRYAPDWRRIINECQRNSIGGELKSTSVSDASFRESIKVLIGFLADKNFKGARQWAAENSHLDGVAAFRAIYDSLGKHAEASSTPNAILILAEYMYKSNFVADKEVNIVACLVELMGNVVWKK